MPKCSTPMLKSIAEKWCTSESGKRRQVHKRFAFTESGISPRALPGTANTLYVSATDDHDEREHSHLRHAFTSAPVRPRMINQKRFRKMELLKKELPAPKLEGPKDADVTLVTCKGSTSGVVQRSGRS